MIQPSNLLEIAHALRLEAAKPGNVIIIKGYVAERFASELTDTANTITDTCLDVLQIFEACAEAVRDACGEDSDAEKAVYAARARWLNRGQPAVLATDYIGES